MRAKEFIFETEAWQKANKQGVAEGIFDRFRKNKKQLTPLPADGSVIKVLGRDVKIEYNPDEPSEIWFIWKDKNGKEQGEAFNSRYDEDGWEYDTYGPPSLEALTKMIAGEIEHQDNPPKLDPKVKALINKQRENDPRLDRIMRDQEARNPSLNDKRTNQIVNLKNMPASSTIHEQGLAEELSKEFDLIERIINQLAEVNQVDGEEIWEDLESLTNDELYVFAVTAPITEDWQKANKQDHTDGMSRKAVSTYRREHPGSKLQTAVTTKPSKLKKGSKASKRRSSYCSRSAGQKKMHHIDCSKTPDKPICKARSRWNCE